ncbi:hypothetical protein AB2B41_02175 [Marimonas sp. MJW-29]|uniref:Uncharacterized protein n=1 Tax=Sulfitobacter sediminis TaxID=3234186 RepID=A0ABV3RHG0_9RHOB
MQPLMASIAMAARPRMGPKRGGVLGVDAQRFGAAALHTHVEGGTGDGDAGGGGLPEGRAGGVASTKEERAEKDRSEGAHEQTVGREG